MGEQFDWEDFCAHDIPSGIGCSECEHANHDALVAAVKSLLHNGYVECDHCGEPLKGGPGGWYSMNTSMEGCTVGAFHENDALNLFLSEPYSAEEIKMMDDHVADQIERRKRGQI